MDQVDHTGSSALHYAACLGYYNVIGLLLSKKAIPFLKDSQVNLGHSTKLSIGAHSLGSNGSSFSHSASQHCSRSNHSQVKINLDHMMLSHAFLGLQGYSWSLQRIITN